MVSCGDDLPEPGTCGSCADKSLREQELYGTGNGIEEPGISANLDDDSADSLASSSDAQQPHARSVAAVLPHIP